MVRGVSKIGIRHHIARQGVDRETVETAYQALTDELPEPELAAARAFVRKRRLGWYRPEAERPEHRRADLAKLLRHGFPTEIARAALDEPLEEEPASAGWRHPVTTPAGRA